MGETFWHVHHYCYGMLKALRAETMDLSPQVRRALLVSAITEVEYVLRRAPPEFVLLPELYLRVGDYQRKLGLVVDAIGSYERSRAVKPDYWPPYVEQAKLNLSIGRRDAAIQVLEAGLALMPQESRLVEELRAARTAPEKPSRSTNRP
jgi:tetratricopeptide (TPR) repeat protein